MKTIKSILLVAALVVSSMVSASSLPEEKNNANRAVTEVIGELLENPNFVLEKELVAKVTLTMNEDNELVVLSVDSDNVTVENYIKSRLNYKALNVTPAQKTFKVPVRLKVNK